MKQLHIIALWCSITGIFFADNLIAQDLHWLSSPLGDLGLVLNQEVSDVKVSANGRFVAFSSRASNVVAGDTNQRSDVFVYDTVKNTAVRLADQFAGQSQERRIWEFSKPTSDGKWISFIGSGDFGFAPTGRHLYLQSLNTGLLGIYSVDANGVAFDVDIDPIFLAEDGSSIIFRTAINLSPLHTDSYKNIYSLDLSNNSFTLLSVSVDKLSSSNREITYFSVSDNSRYVAMATSATNMVDNFQPHANLYLRDNTNLTTQLVTVNPNGDPSGIVGSEFMDELAVSNTGYVAFKSRRADLVANDNNDEYDLFLFNGSNNTRISVDENGQELSEPDFESPVFSADGTRLVFTESNSLLAEDNHSVPNIYLYRIDRPGLSQVTHVNSLSSGLSLPRAEAKGFSTNGESLILMSNLNQTNSANYTERKLIYEHDFNSEQISEVSPAIFSPDTAISSTLFPVISQDQQWVVYGSSARNHTNPVKPDNNFDLFLLNRTDNSKLIIGRQVDEYPPDISLSGRFVAYSSEFAQPAGDTDLGASYIFLYDRQEDQYRQIAKGVFPKVNSAGKVAFLTSSSLLANDTNGTADLYLFDIEDDSLSLVSVNTQGVAGNGGSYDFDINDMDNETWLVFMSRAEDLVANDNNNHDDIFMRQWPNGPTLRVSQTATSVGGDGGSGIPSITADGRRVAFHSTAKNLTSDDYSAAGAIQGFLYDRINQNIELISKQADNLPVSGSVANLSISNLGGYIAYLAYFQLLPEDDDSTPDIYLYDVYHRSNKLISKTSDNQQVSENFEFARVVEDVSVSPPRVSVTFLGQGSLTGIAAHPGYYEAFLYQQNGRDQIMFADGFE